MIWPMKIVILIHLFVLHRCQYIQKCCDEKQQLARNFETCVQFHNNELERYDNTSEEDMTIIKIGEKDHHHLWWLPRSIQFVSSISHSSKFVFKPIPMANITDLSFRYGQKAPCQNPDKEFVPFTDDVFILDNGSLLITNVNDNVRPGTMIFPPASYCLDRVSMDRPKRSHAIDHSYVVVLCPCLYMPCLRMCCGWKHYLKVDPTGYKCEYSSNISLKWNLDYLDYFGGQKKISKYAIVQNTQTCKNGQYFLNTDQSASYQRFRVLPNGEVRTDDSTLIAFQDYCIHYTNLNGTFRTNLFICKAEPKKDLHLKDYLYGGYFTIGAIFLALTLLVYAVVPDIRQSLHAKILMNHVACSCVCDITLALTQLHLAEHICIMAAYVIQFTFIASVFWLNVMCIDIAFTFNGYKNMNRSRYNSDTRLFVKYSMYAWILSATISTITVFADHIKTLDARYQPRFGIRRCWFYDSTALVLYFYLPVTVLLIINIGLFTFSSLKIFNMTEDLSKILRTGDEQLNIVNFKKEKYRFTLYVKLCFLMGVTWIFEIASWLIGGPEYYWYITDGINSLRGIFVFYIFCGKRSILMAVLNKMPICVKSRFETRIQNNSSSTRVAPSSNAESSQLIQMQILTLR